MVDQPYFDGPPRFNVGLKPIAAQDWLMPDDQAHWLGQKNALIDAQAPDVMAHWPSSVPAQHEAANLIRAECSSGQISDALPLLEAARLVSDDLIVMEHVDGQWTNTACCLCSPTFFSASFAIGKTLATLHDPIPDGDFDLSGRIARVFTNLADSAILERHNWTVQWSDARYTPDATAIRAQAARADIGQGTQHLFLRVERQTIRRLPVSRAILFTIRIRLSPLAQLLNDPKHHAAFVSAWQNASPAVRAYKKWAVLERHVSALLGEN